MQQHEQCKPVLTKQMCMHNRYKQRGKEAETACNVFYHLTYEGAVDLDRIEDPMQLKVIATPVSLYKDWKPII